MIFHTFACYASCKLELEKIELSRKEFFESIPGVGLKGISYADFLETSSSRSKMSYISDLIAEWDKKNIVFRRYCISTIQMCDGWLELMDEKNRMIFKKRYTENKTLKEVGDEIGHDESYVGKLIRKECKRLKDTIM